MIVHLSSVTVVQRVEFFLQLHEGCFLPRQPARAERWFRGQTHPVSHEQDSTETMDEVKTTAHDLVKTHHHGKQGAVVQSTIRVRLEHSTA